MNTPSSDSSDGRASNGHAKAASYGLALKRLRIQAGMSQAEAADAAGLSQAAWGKYESGKSLAFLSILNQEKCVWALGQTLAALEAARAAVDSGQKTPVTPTVSTFAMASFPLPVEGSVKLGENGFGVFEDDVPPLAGIKTFDIKPLLDQGARILQVASEEMSPYADPGGFVVYSVTTPPRRNLGAVIKRHDGRFLIRRYVRTTPSHVVCVSLEQTTVDGRAAYIEREELLPLAEIEGVYPISLRGDGLA
jgi:DNA-binding XRE family transcriptional regulator